MTDTTSQPITPQNRRNLFQQLELDVGCVGGLNVPDVAKDATVRRAIGDGESGPARHARVCEDEVTSGIDLIAGSVELVKSALLDAAGLCP